MIETDGPFAPEPCLCDLIVTEDVVKFIQSVYVKGNDGWYTLFRRNPRLYYIYFDPYKLEPEIATSVFGTTQGANQGSYGSEHHIARRGHLKRLYGECSGTIAQITSSLSVGDDDSSESEGTIYQSDESDDAFVVEKAAKKSKTG